MWVIDSPRARAAVAAGWLVFASVNATLMYLLPGKETIPYHLIWASFAYLYGITVWPAPVTWSVFGAITVVTGTAMLRQAHSGVIGWEECSEIVLMGVIAALLIWHVDRHQAARRRIAELREVEAVRAGNRELATRFGSHELRTRLTIARGFVELIRDEVDDPELRAYAGLSVTELDKATALTRGLMTLVRVDADLPLAPTDFDELVGSVARRWSAHAERDWRVDARAGVVLCHAERFEAALDCLVENAVKFTSPGDRIAIGTRCEGGDLVLTVADSGVGIPPDELDKVTDLFHTSRTAGTRAGNGLGLPIVRATAEARGGSLSIASALGSGTTITFRVPAAAASHTREQPAVHATAQTVRAAPPAVDGQACPSS